MAGNTLYGATTAGGASGNGIVFAVKTDGTGFTNLHSFAAGGYDPSNGFTNSDGASPEARLVLSGDTLYGTALNGGNWGAGTAFAIKTDGAGFTNLHSFTALSIGPPYPRTNSDGGGPFAGLVLSGNTLYGTTFTGGNSGNGTVFALSTAGTGFTNLHSFTALLSNKNGDGANAQAALVVSGDTLYGTTTLGGSFAHGTLFAIKTDGTGFSNLHSLADGDGTSPNAGLLLSGNTLYGTAVGGNAGNGTVFSLSFAPQLAIAASGTNVVLSWPISYSGFSYAGYVLQETLNLGSANGWTSVLDSNPPVIVDGQFRITRPMLGSQWSYRLKKL